jgi:membrane protein YqaA with SNARE-associated domain
MMIFYTMLAQLTNYGIGFFIEKKILHRFVKDKKREFMSSLKKYDIVFIIVLNIVPLPADLLSVILGMIKYDLKKAMFYTFIGKVLKYVFLGILFFVMKAF